MTEIDVALLIVRLAVGSVMLAHGVKHARGRERTTAWFASIGFRMPGVQWLASTATEIGVGVLLVAGALTTFAAAGLIGIMAVAFWSVHRSVGFWVTARPDEGWEYVFTLAAAGAALAVAGPGSVSIDHAVGIDEVLRGWVGAVAVGAGILGAAAQVITFYRPQTSAS
jgi:putative oxidoreductase